MDIIPHVDTDWKIIALSVLCAVQMYSTIKKTFWVKWTHPEDVITKGQSADAITLRVFQGSGVTVSSSPFSSKMEMYCRLTSKF